MAVVEISESRASGSVGTATGVFTVSPDVAMRRDSQRFAVRRQAVVLYAELRNYTRVADVLEPVTALDLATRFFDLIDASARAHDGELMAVHNDAAMAVFRSGKPAGFTQQAVRAAQAIQREFAVLEAEWREAFGLQTAISMGLHLGDTVFGAGGATGSEHFVAFGETVSIASRLMERARGGEFVMSDSVMGALSLSNLEIASVSLPPLVLPRRPAIGVFGVLLDTGLDFT